jgi:cation:H+ antiporter
VVLGTAMADGHVTRPEGGLLLVAYRVYVAYLLAEGRTASADASHAEVAESHRRRLARSGRAVVTGVAIYLGGDLTVSSLATLADALEISPAIASVTILSIGTTLPELAISVAAARLSRRWR